MAESALDLVLLFKLLCQKMSLLKPEKPSFMEQLMEKSIHILNREDTRKKLQIYLIDPLLNHVMERIFPYIVLICVLFALLLIVAMMTFGMLILQHRPVLWSLPFTAPIEPR
jgi:hypothetical protein